MFWTRFARPILVVAGAMPSAIKTVVSGLPVPGF
jgi:hypothetical protein